MKKLFFKVIPLSLLLSVVFMSCKKTIIDKEFSSTLSNETIENLSTWYKYQINKENKSSSNGLELNEGIIIWDKTISLSDNDDYLIPIDIQSKSSIRKILHINIQKSTNTNSGEYIYIINDNPSDKILDDNKKLSALIINREIQNFTGCIIKYNLNNQLLSTENFKNGIKSESKTIIITLKEINNNNSITSKNTMGRCIAWYLDTYINGVLVYSQYLYTSCTSPEEWTDTIEGEGGGTIPEVGDPVTTSKEILRSIVSYSENWIIVTPVTLVERKFLTHPQDNYFTGATAATTAFLNFAPASGGINGWNLATSYCIPTSTAQSANLIGQQVAAAIQQSVIFYPNWQATYGTPRTDAYTTSKNWNASFDL